MSVANGTPYPSLGDSARAAREQARAEKAASSRLRRWGKRIMASLALAFAVLGMSSGSAQAWPWDVGDNVVAYMENFCKPNNLSVSGYRGADTSLGLNHAMDSSFESKKRGTIKPNAEINESEGGGGLKRLRAAYEDSNSEGYSADTLNKPSYERYGFSSLQWTNYGGGCMTVGYWFTPAANVFLSIMVHGPMIIAMGVLSLVLPSAGGSFFVYDIWSKIISQFTEPFTDIFTPFALIIAPIGAIWVWASTRSTQALIKAATWIILIFGTMVWLGSNTSTVAKQVNTVVVSFTSTAAEAINETTQGETEDKPKDQRDEINQALWYGVPYQTWLVGEVGAEQAAQDINSAKDGKLGWGPAILNGMYVGNDGLGRSVERDVEKWNASSYAPETDGFDGKGADTKVSRWTDDGIWRAIPFLYNVKAMCNDSTAKGDGSDEAKKNRWLYGGECDAKGADTTGMVKHFTGQEYNHRLVTVFSGALGVMAVVLALLLISLYLSVQMLMFFFMLLFAPVFLTVSLFADEKRRAFGIRFFELLIANVLKQVAAVLALLFVSHAMSTLLSPTMTGIPWMMKPIAAVLFLFALVMFMFPMISIVKAAAKGDTSVVDKTYNAPAKAAGSAAKAAVVTGAVVATGGAAAGVLGGTGAAAASGKLASVATTAGRAMGRRGGVGKGVHTLGRAMHLGNSIGATANDSKAAKMAQDAGVGQMLSGESGKNYLAKLRKSDPGLFNKEGGLTAAGMKRAKKDFKGQVNAGYKQRKADSMYQEHMSGFFENHRLKEGHDAAQSAGVPMSKDGTVLDQDAAAKAGLALDKRGRPIQHHDLDPEGPKMREALAAQQEKARHEEARMGNMDGDGGTGGDTGEDKPKPQVPAGIRTDPKTGLPVDPALAGAVAAGVALNEDGTVRDPAQAHDAGLFLDSDNRPLTPAAATALNNGGQHSDNVRERTYSQDAEEMTRKGFADQARSKVDGPSFARDENIKANVEVSGADVLSQLGLTQQDAAGNPLAALSGTAYENGQISAMDPRHPATPALHDLKWAAAKGTEDEAQSAMIVASEAISAHGVPDQVNGMYSTGSTAAQFRTADVVGVMPSLTEDTSWQERAEGARATSIAAATLPDNHPATPEVQQYVSALSNPALDSADVEHLKGEAIAALGRAEQVAPDTGGGQSMFSDGPSVVPVPVGAVSVGESNGESDGVAPMAEPTQHAQAAPAPAAMYTEPSPVVLTEGVPEVDAAVAHRAHALGAIPMSSADDDLGYSTVVAGQSFTSSSRAPLDALNAHAEAIASPVFGGDGPDVSPMDHEIREIAVGAYGVTPVREGIEPMAYTADVGGFQYTADDESALQKFTADANDLVYAPEPGSTTPPEGSHFTMAQTMLADVGEQYHLDRDAAAAFEQYATPTVSVPIETVQDHAPVDYDAPSDFPAPQWGPADTTQPAEDVGFPAPVGDRAAHVSQDAVDAAVRKAQAEQRQEGTNWRKPPEPTPQVDPEPVDEAPTEVSAPEDPDTAMPYYQSKRRRRSGFFGPDEGESAESTNDEEK